MAVSEDARLADFDTSKPRDESFYRDSRNVGLWAKKRAKQMGVDLGGKFEEQAKLNSEDGSAAKGGELGWISPGDTVPDFEAAMGRLKVGELSAPVRTNFGWHLIEVEERRTQDITAERQRDQARLSLRQRKSDEMFQDWVRQQRDRTYIEIKLDEK